MKIEVTGQSPIDQDIRHKSLEKISQAPTEVLQVLADFMGNPKLEKSLVKNKGLIKTMYG